MESASNKLTLKYHDIFDYPLTAEELKKWKVGRKFSTANLQFSINKKQNFQFIKGRQTIINKRLQNEKYSKKKLKLAKTAAKLISKIPTVKFVGITGALAMNNAGKNSDIDLMIVTKANTLWITRLNCYIIIWLNGYKTRHPKSKLEKDKLCINLWLDESDLIWDKNDRNLYTAHEIAQIVPLLNKDKTYEKFLYLNKWILSYWPNSVGIRRYEEKVISSDSSFLSLILSILEQFAFKMQYIYMKPKITREVISKTRAIFHPNDWGKVVLKKLKDNIYKPLMFGTADKVIS